MSTLISLDIELNSIRSFLKTVLDAADLEYQRIMNQSEAGEYEHYEDEGNALYFPMMREEFALRATVGKLNALVEWEMQNLASRAFFETKNVSKSRKAKTVYELKINQVVDLIEKYYAIKVNETLSYLDFVDIRKKVNSFKHRKGFKDPRRNGGAVIPEKFKIDRKETFQRIDSVKNYLKDLWSKTKDK